MSHGIRVGSQVDRCKQYSHLPHITFGSEGRHGADVDAAAPPQNIQPQQGSLHFKLSLFLFSHLITSSLLEPIASRHTPSPLTSTVAAYHRTLQLHTHTHVACKMKPVIIISTLIALATAQNYQLQSYFPGSTFLDHFDFVRVLRESTSFRPPSKVNNG